MPLADREGELRRLSETYNRVVPASFLEKAEANIESVVALLDRELTEPMRRALLDIVRAEQAFVPPDFDKLDLQQQVELKKKLKKWELRREDGEEIARRFLFLLFGSLANKLPKTADPSPFTIPLIYAVPEPREFIEMMVLELFDDNYRDRDLFSNLREQLYSNMCRASGIEPTSQSNKKLIFPTDANLPLDETARVYLRNTPLLGLFMTPVPLKLTHEERFNHWHILGGTGAGKTTLIENLILHDLKGDEPPSLVVIDPHGDLIRKLVSADLGIEDRIVVIDPRDIDHPVALNPFAVNRERLGNYDRVTQEQVTAGVIETFDYLFSGLLGSDLTTKQGVFFKYIARLMLALPDGGVLENGELVKRNATILDMFELMDDPAPYAVAIETLPPIPRAFFQKEFNLGSFRATREQIRYRLQAVIENPTIARLFTAPETKLDLFTEMNRGAVILVDTAKDFLKGASSNFGRIFISLVLQAVLERAAIPANLRKPTFLIVDEAGSYFDSNIDNFLTEARKYKCGIVLAHQYLDQATGSLRSSIAANTGIKFVGGASAPDARTMASELRTSADFILSQPRYHFAAHIRNVTPQAVSVPVPRFESPPQLTREAYDALIDRNRARVAFADRPKVKQLPAPPSPAVTEENDDEW